MTKYYVHYIVILLYDRQCGDPAYPIITRNTHKWGLVPYTHFSSLKNEFLAPSWSYGTTDLYIHCLPLIKIILKIIKFWKDLEKWGVHNEYWGPQALLWCESPADCLPHSPALPTASVPCSASAVPDFRQPFCRVSHQCKMLLLTMTVSRAHKVPALWELVSQGK